MEVRKYSEKGSLLFRGKESRRGEYNIDSSSAFYRIIERTIASAKIYRMMKNEYLYIRYNSSNTGNKASNVPANYITGSCV